MLLGSSLGSGFHGCRDVTRGHMREDSRVNPTSARPRRGQARRFDVEEAISLSSGSGGRSTGRRRYILPPPRADALDALTYRRFAKTEGTRALGLPIRRMGGKSFVCLFGILLSARITLQASSSSSPYYVGAAVEYYPVTKGDNGTVIANENAKNYVKFLKKASEHEVDIIVFPEGSLTAGRSFPAEERTRYLPHSSYVPDPKDRVTPCKNDTSTVMQALKAVSCAARQYTTYIVVNVREKAKCTSEMKTCSTDGYQLYNTNVVFDRTGMVVARYRKYNLFGEPGFNITVEPELSTFRTDFDVTFGQFICFDILFEKPALQLVRDSKVTDILFSSEWFSELPFLTAPEIQSAWSYANNVNFLGSGYNDPSRGSGGSGIYAGVEGSLNSMWSEKRVNALLVSKIPRVVGGRRNQRADPTESMTYLFPASEIPTIDGAEPVPQQKLLNDDIAPYTTKLFPPTNGTYSLTLCDRGLCCDFSTDTTHQNSLSSNNVKYYRYRFAVFNGVRSFAGKGTGGVEICSIISCTDETEESCNKRFDINEIIAHPVTFNSIVIAGNFTVGPSVHRMPMGINTDLQPLNATDFTFLTTNLNQTHANLKYSLRKSCKGLMTFGIWGRNFTADGSPKTIRSSANHSTPFMFMLVMLIILGIGSTYAMGVLPNAA